MNRWFKSFLLFLSILFIAACSSKPKFDQKSNLMVDEEGNLKLSRPLYQCYLDSGKVALATQLSSEQSAKVTYWKKGKRSQARTIKLSPSWDQIHFAIPDGVEPSEVYECQLEVDGYTSSVFEFKPGVREGEGFKFLAIGDTRPGFLKPHQEVVGEMEKIEDASFYIHVGDFVNEGNPIADWNTFFSVHETLLSRIPILPVIGNHDISNSMYFSGLFLMKARSKDPKRYYSIDYGNVQIIALDSNVPIEVGDEQYQFLIDQLEKGKKNQVDHMVVALHHPIYSSGRHGSNAYLQKVLSPVFEKYGVGLVLTGHDHHYERTHPVNGVVYVVTGGGGSRLYDVSPREFTAKGLRSFHFVEISVEGKEMKMRAINHKGHVIDQYTF